MRTKWQSSHVNGNITFILLMGNHYLVMNSKDKGNPTRPKTQSLLY